MLGNCLPAARSIGGHLRYAAAYLTALNEAQIAIHAAVLEASDDAPR